MASPQATAALSDLKLKTLAADLREDRKKLAPDWKYLQGQVFERVLTLARMSKQDAAFEMGYLKSDGSADPSQVSRWVSGAERVQWDRVASVDQLRPWIPVAWGEFTNASVQVTVVVKVA